MSSMVGEFAWLLMGCRPIFVMNVCQLRSYIMLDDICIVLGLSP